RGGGDRTVLKDEFCAFKFWSPLSEFFNIQVVIFNNVYINMQFGRFILFDQSVRNKSIRSAAVIINFTVHKITSALYMPLVDQLFKRLLFHHQADVLHKLIPETAVQ